MFLRCSPPPEPPQPSSSSQSPLYCPSMSPLPVSIWSREPSFGMDFPCRSYMRRGKIKHVLLISFIGNILWFGVISLQDNKKKKKKILSVINFPWDIEVDMPKDPTDVRDWHTPNEPPWQLKRESVVGVLQKISVQLKTPIYLRLAVKFSSI